MDVSEFQKKLEEICNVAEENNKKLTTDQVREHFQMVNYLCIMKKMKTYMLVEIFINILE